MYQILNISQVRNKLAQVVRQVNQTQKPIIVVQDSLPVIVLMPYQQVLDFEQKQENDWQEELGKLMQSGRKLGAAYLKSNLRSKKYGLKHFSEDQLYQLIKND